MSLIPKKAKKLSIVSLLTIMLSVSIFGYTLSRPTPVHAQFVDVNQGLRNVTDNIGDALLGAGLGALVNGASYFMRKIAYDTAKYIAAGGKGQEPLAFNQGFGAYLKDTALDSAGSAIEQLGEPFGLNLCKPPDLRLQIGLQVSISNIYQNSLGGTGGPTPRCTWNDFTESWKNAPDTLFSDQSLLERFNTSLKTSQGDIGAALSIFGKVDNIIAQQQLANQLSRVEGQGFKSVSDIISGDIKTPAMIIAEETKGQLTAANQTKLNTDQIAGIYGAGAVQILPMALSVFANTLVNSLLQNVLEKGLLPNRSGDAGSVADFYASTINSNRSVAEAAFSYLIAGIPQRPLTAYDVVTEYSTCGTNPGLNNCVMDSGMVQALDRARVQSALTIGEAIQQNLLHANWQLIPASRDVDNTNLQFCYSGAYCLSNIEKLRKARILPLGFEVAARKSDPDKPWVLGDVVRGFNDCDPSGKPTAALPFCKLIDPNWILKSPEARCEAKVNGPELLTASAATRRQECVDFSTCLQTDANGQCIGFGYCTQEENVWKMPGASCPAYYNTCKTYTSATNGQVASYLSRTLDIQSCSADSVGCRAYSTDKTGDSWVASSKTDAELTFSGRTQAIHLNSNVSKLQCPANAEGCNLFVDPATEEKIFLKKAPDYLGCYDVVPETKNTIEWPTTQAELTKLGTQKSAACSGFAGACIPDEVGCQQYRPQDGSMAVTGVVGGNTCPAQCVGYETFKQEGTIFEAPKFPLNFIAKNAQTCSIQNVGCDEFTNIGAGAAGGESLEYYSNLKHCELPSNDNGKAFYSWEGSEIEGFVLKRHVLLKVTQTDAAYITGLGLGAAAVEFPVGSPAYVDDTKAALQANYARCNQASYNILLNNPYNPGAAHPDCRAFYDSNGGIYYRILRDTVTVSNACTPLRKTNSELFVDPNIGNATTCQAKGGVFENNQCRRCYSGGKYEVNTLATTNTGGGNSGDSSHQDGGSTGTTASTVVGSCIYQSIKSEATSCPASANGCRSYIGNTGNNIYEVASFGFEPTDASADALNEAKKGWSGTTSVEAESLQVGLHSLRVNNANTSYTFDTGKIQPGAWYELRFWARGNAVFGISSGFAQNGQVVGNAFTYDALINSNVLAPLSTEWQEYHVGPVQFTGDPTKAAQLYFGAQAIGVANTNATYNTTLIGATGVVQNVQGFRVTYTGIKYVAPRWNVYISPPTAANKPAIINAVASVLGISQAAATTIVNTQTTYNGSTVVLIKENVTQAEYPGITNPLIAAGANLFIGAGPAEAQERAQYRAQIITEIKSIMGLNDTEAAAFVDNPPNVIKDGIAAESDAIAIRQRIINAGGQATIDTTTVSHTDTTALVNQIVSVLGVDQAAAQNIVDIVVGGHSAGLKSNSTQAEAQNIKSRLEAAGGQVAITQSAQAQAPIAVNQFYFLDNVSLVQIGGAASDHVFLVKNSWRTPEGYEVPLACDATPNNGVPGQALGCRAYTQTDGQSANLTGFDRLCRAEAIGCRAVVDTQNTVTGVKPEEKQAYGVVCRKPNSTATVTSTALCSVTLSDGTQNPVSYSCTVAKGKTDCRIKTSVVLTNALHLQTTDNCISDGAVSANNSCTGAKDKLFVDKSTVVIKADSDTIYLTHRNEFVCAEQQLGCMKVGLEQQNIASTSTGAYSYQETYVKNDPRTYGDTLCTGDQVGCAAFKQNNTLTYFKDPKITGNSMCVYKENVVKGSQKYSGWFLDGAGTCSGGVQNGKICKADAECGAGIKCDNVGTTACYENYLQSGNSYGLWSQGTAKYAGFVGMCDVANNGCTELVDRASFTSSSPTGKSYFVLLNDKLTENVGKCEGKVSQKEGCVLFDMTENPSKIYNTALSYTASETSNPPDSLVDPSQADPKNANIILKVDRDRQCHEWLACRSSVTVTGADGKPQSLCQEYAACNELGPSGECLSWVDSSKDNTRLTEEEYIKRPTSWTSPEYSGYSLFGAFNPSDYVYLLFPESTDAYLAYEMSPSFFVKSTGFEARGCRQLDASQSNYVKADGDKCGFDDGGRCYRQRCLYPIKGSFTFDQNVSTNATTRSTENIKGMLSQLEPGICKSYPEADSPFPISVAVTDPNKLSDRKPSEDGTLTRVEFTEKKDDYARANVCQPGSTSKDCSCEYIKVQYKNAATDYWPVGTTLIPVGVCSGGSEYEGKPCNSDKDNQCGTGGKCNLVERKSVSYGQKGLCLEYDLSRPIGQVKSTARQFESFQCLTWLPIQVSASSVDLYNTVREAGYNSDVDSLGGGQAYCTESTNRAAGYFSRKYSESENQNLGGTPFVGAKLSDKTGVNNLFIYKKGDNGQNVNFNNVFDTVENKYQITETNGDIYKGLMLDDPSETNAIGTYTKNAMYRLMQAWAWRNIGQSARVLRFDALNGKNTRGYISPEWEKIKTDGYTVYSFAPYIGTASLDSQLDNEEGNAGDTGVLMHPPRFMWEKPSKASFTSSDYLVSTISGFSPSVSAVTDIHTANTSIFAAGGNMDQASENISLIDKDSEEWLHEGDLSALYFVPLAYPYGASGPNPATLTKEVKLPFKDLRNALDDGVKAKPLSNSVWSTSVYESKDSYNQFISFGEDTHMINLSYALQRTGSSQNCYGLISYCNYDQLSPSGGLWNQYLGQLNGIGNQPAIPGLKQRNEVYRRYVTVVYNKTAGKSPFNFDAQTATADQLLSNDPFAVECKYSEDNNWIAIGLDFNVNGEFLGYISRWCNGQKDHDLAGAFDTDWEHGNGIRFATIADLQDRCVEYTAVVDAADPAGDNNKAWTDRVWLNSSYTPQPGSFFNAIKGIGVKPYGSLAQSDANINSMRTYPNGFFPPFYGFGNYNFGVPYQCYGGDGFGSAISNGNYIFQTSNDCVAPVGQESLATKVAGNLENGPAILRNLFMKYYAVKSVENFNIDFFTRENDDKSGDISLLDNTITPSIYSINPYKCNQQGGTCVPGEANNFTINSRNYTLSDYSGDGIADEDRDQDGYIDPIIAEGTYTAVINFFATADDNRMPIRRVMVNWGDGTPNTNDGVFGLYKNRKPFCAADSVSIGDVGRCSGTQLTCKVDTDCAFVGGVKCIKQTTLKFGDAQRACDDNYFEFSHTYGCSITDADAKKVSTLQGTDPKAYERLMARSGITSDSMVCVITPAVQVLDNWGWCNGSCPASYNKDGNPIGSPQNGCYSEVHWASPNQSSFYNQCKPSVTTVDGTSNPWTKFKGSIIVIPN